MFVYRSELIEYNKLLDSQEWTTIYIQEDVITPYFNDCEFLRGIDDSAWFAAWLTEALEGGCLSSSSSWDRGLCQRSSQPSCSGQLAILDNRRAFREVEEHVRSVSEENREFLDHLGDLSFVILAMSSASQ